MDHQMGGTQVPHVEIWEDGLTDPAALHASLAAALGFPAYYGANLAALSDCLEDIDSPCQIVVSRAPGARRLPWFDAFCAVFQRAARNNPAIDVRLLDDAAPEAGLDQVLAHLERIERRLDALQDAAAPSVGATAALPEAPKVASETCRNMASGSDGDRFECGTCGCRVSDYLEDTRQLIDGLKYCPNCGREVANPAGSNALGWVGELI